MYTVFSIWFHLLIIQPEINSIRVVTDFSVLISYKSYKVNLLKVSDYLPAVKIYMKSYYLYLLYWIPGH